MAKTVEMPRMGYDMTEGKISRWIKQEGDAVKVGDSIAEIETDKVSIEIEAFEAGVLRKIIRQVGETVPVGGVIGVIGEANEPLDLAALGLGGASAPAPSAPSGNGREPATAGAEAARPLPAGPLTLPTTGGLERLTAPSRDQLKVSPIARRLAEQHGVDLAGVSGSGPGGRIVKDDIEAHLRQAPAAPVTVAAPATPTVAPTPVVTPTPTPAPTPVPTPALVAAATPAGAQEIPLSRMRQAIARVTSQSKQQAPHIYLTVEVLMDEALALRQQLNAALESEGVKVSVNDLVVKAVAKALVKHRGVNASFGGDKIIVHPSVNVGVAVSLDDGLITPVVRDCDLKPISQIAQETRDLAARARAGTLKPDDLSGGTFTVSNLGPSGPDDFVAIIVPPQAGILAVGTAAKRPVVKDDQLAIATTMRLTLSADHRVVDGAPAAIFLSEIRRLLETPILLLT